MINFCHILAMRPGWRHYGYREYTGVYFESNSREAWILLTVTAVLVVGILVWHFVASRSRVAPRSNSPSRLFRELCGAHGLSRARRRLLKRLAVARGLNSPALLFVQPESFESAGLPDDLRDQATELELLRDRLFGTPQTA